MSVIRTRMPTRSMKKSNEERPIITQVPNEFTNVDALCHGSVKSVRSGRTSNSMRSLAMAKLKEKHILAQVELDKQRLEVEAKAKLQAVRQEIELAELESALSEVDENDEIASRKSEHSEKNKFLKRFLSDCERRDNFHDCRSNLCEGVTNSKEFYTSNDLPKITLSSFDGDVKDYWPFIKQFEIDVECKTNDPRRRLLLLMNHCVGEAKEAIAHCMVKTGGYEEAKAILKENFGQPFSISNRLIEDLLRQPKVSPNAPEMLNRLGRKMRNCLSTLEEIGYLDDLNSLNLLKQLVLKLPESLREKWGRHAQGVEKSGRRVVFSDLSAMVKEEADYARTEFGRLAKDPEFRRPVTSGWTQDNKRPVLTSWNQNGKRDQGNMFKKSVNLTLKPNITDSRELLCPNCGQNHKLDDCSTYLQLEVKDRWSYLKNNGYCYRCLQLGHLTRSCLSKKMCSIDGCGKGHHDTLHKVECKQGSCNRTNVSEFETVVGVVPVMVVGPGGSQKVNALIDNGSNITLLSEKVRKKLGIEGLNTKVKVETVTGNSSLPTRKCEFTILSSDGKNSIHIEDALTVASMPKAFSANAVMDVSREWNHLKGIEFQRIQSDAIDLLIGCDVPEAHMVFEQRFGGRKDPYAVKGKLGWVLFGPIGSDVKSTTLMTTVDRNPVEELIKSLYNKEFEDMTDTKKELSIEEKLAVNIVSEACKYENGRYNIALPWRSDSVTLPNNRSYAMKRLSSLRGRFNRDPSLWMKYNEIIQSHLRKDYIEPVSQENQVTGARVWYLPHHPVIHPKKPGKVRIVFDCAAKFQGKSLNEALFPGPDTISNLMGILLRFRRYPVALAADIEEMFLQVQVPAKDRDVLRFLWWTDESLEEPMCYRIKVHPFGATSSPFCANFALKQAVRDFGIDCGEVVNRVATRDMYVDDCITSVKTIEEAKEVVGSLSNIFKSGGFRLRKWVSNRREVLVDVDKADLANENMQIPDRQSNLERTLGIVWDAENDKFQFQFQCVEKVASRRGLLACVSSIFDPLGLIAPFIMPAKMILQNVCRKGKGWDAALEEEDVGDWERWKDTMNQLKCIDLDRCAFDAVMDEGVCQLHVFADASEKGYGAVAYVRHEREGKGLSVKLLMSKARVAPLKTVTVPRLELTAAVLAVRVMRCVQREFHRNFERVILWTDSVLVLRYIRNTTSRFCTFVANRVEEILESSNGDQWRHVGSKMNPADLVSRGSNGNQADFMMWFKGPTFLGEGEDKWPAQDILPLSLEGMELKKTVLSTLADSVTKPMDRLVEYYSSWTKMKRAVAWLTRFKRYLTLMVRGKGSMVVGPLKCCELMNSEKDIIMYVQRQCFREEFERLRLTGVGGKVDLKISSLRKLSPICVEGLLRVGGRLQLSDWDYDSKHPVILPKEHAVTRAIVNQLHLVEGHSGVAHVLAAARRRYWIVQGGSTIKHILAGCLKCKRYHASPMQQQMAPLPKSRVTDGWYPFQYVGVDYFGPFQVKRGRSLEKRYGCLFTCLQCRAVHIEITHSMTTDSFLMALKRFMDKQGSPKEIHSDNGSNFVGSEREIFEWIGNLDRERLVERMSELSVKWIFNPPHASHRGGIWERLIRSIRKVLNAMDWRQGGDEETLITFLSHAERIINDRPLTTVWSDDKEPSPLRPSDLLRPRCFGGLLIDTPLELLARKRWRIVNNLTTSFWKRWRKEYLPTLQVKQKWLLPHRQVKVGDLVMIVTEQSPKGSWPLGIVTAVYEDGDGIVRTVDLKTADGVCKRDIRKVCLLEGVG